MRMKDNEWNTMTDRYIIIVYQYATMELDVMASYFVCCIFSKNNHHYPRIGMLHINVGKWMDEMRRLSIYTVCECSIVTICDKDR